MAYGIMFHHFHDALHPKGQGAISAQQLRDLLEYVGRERILPAEEWMARAFAGQLRTEDVCLSFDDALLCQYDVALPVLADFGLTAFWFIYSSVFENNIEYLEIYRFFRTTIYDNIDLFYDDFLAVADRINQGLVRAALQAFEPEAYLVGFPFYSRNDRIFRYVRDVVLGPKRYDEAMLQLMKQNDFDPIAASAHLWMSNDHIRELHQSGHVVGLHSYSHPTRLRELDRRAQAQEYLRNWEHVRRITGKAPMAMSHPCNSYNDDTLAVLHDLGIKLGFRANLEPVQPQSALEFPRQDHANIIAEMESPA